MIAKPTPQDLLPHAVEKVAQVSAQGGDVVNVKCPLTPTWKQDCQCTCDISCALSIITRIVILFYLLLCDVKYPDLVPFIEGSKFAFKSSIYLWCVQCQCRVDGIVCTEDERNFRGQIWSPQLKGRCLEISDWIASIGKYTLSVIPMLFEESCGILIEFLVKAMLMWTDWVEISLGEDFQIGFNQGRI